MSGDVRRNLHPFPSLLQQRHNKSHFSTTPSSSGTRSVSSIHWSKLKEKIEVYGRDLYGFSFFFSHPFLFLHFYWVSFCVSQWFSVSASSSLCLHQRFITSIVWTTIRTLMMMMPVVRCLPCYWLRVEAVELVFSFPPYLAVSSLIPVCNTRIWFPLLTLNCTLLHESLWWRCPFQCSLDFDES